ncbi:hypothetical protein DFJ73DRAFT_958510 [Zopfochytrium polystomum]|nr:hypothetical protein DFJ73DRAFT_958510 [Zopfochytrium polystomum]
MKSLEARLLRTRGQLAEATQVYESAIEALPTVLDKVAMREELIALLILQSFMDKALVQAVESLESLGFKVGTICEGDVAQRVEAQRLEMRRLLYEKADDDIASTRCLDPIKVALQGACVDAIETCELKQRTDLFWLYGLQAGIQCLTEGVTAYSLELFAFLSCVGFQPMKRPDFDFSERVIRLCTSLEQRTQPKPFRLIKVHFQLLFYMHRFLLPYSDTLRKMEELLSFATKFNQAKYFMYFGYYYGTDWITHGVPPVVWKERQKEFSPLIARLGSLATAVWNGVLHILTNTFEGKPFTLPQEFYQRPAMRRLIRLGTIISSIMFSKWDRLLPDVNELLSAQSLWYLFAVVPVLLGKILGLQASLTSIDADKNGAVPSIKSDSTHESPEGGSAASRDEIVAEIKQLAELVEGYTSRNEEQRHKATFARAECALAGRDYLAAMQLYEQAISQADVHGWTFWKCVFNERYGRLLIALNLNQMASTVLTQTYAGWNAWGSEEKCAQLREAFGSLIEEPLDRVTSINTVASTRGRQTRPIGTRQPGAVVPSQSLSAASSGLDDVDVIAVLKVIESIRSEKSMETMLVKIMESMVANAGATFGLLILDDQQDFIIAASVEVTGGKNMNVRVLQNERVSKGDSVSPAIPLSIVGYVISFSEPVSIHNCATSMYQNDVYVRKKQPKSVLCCPLLHQSVTTGVVYLENALQVSAFTQSRMDFIQAIIPTTAMAIVNLRLEKKNLELAEALKATGAAAAAAAAKSRLPRYSFNAPIQKALIFLRSLRDSVGPTDQETADEIGRLMKALTSTDMFETTVDDINDEDGHGLDQDTKRYIQNSLVRPNREPTLKRTSGVGPQNSMSTIAAAKQRDKGKIAAKLVQPVGVNQAEIEKILSKCDSIDFDVFALSRASHGRPLFYLSYHLLTATGLLQSLNINAAVVMTFLQTIESNYHDHPYHNSAHAADVLQTSALLLSSDERLQSRFTELEIFALYVAAAVHDVNHPGVNNAFLIQTGHQMAGIYNDISVLEAHHASKAFEIARMPGCDVFAAFENGVRVKLRQMIISLVLSTDLSSHFTYINKFKGKLTTAGMNLEDASNKSLVLEMAIKCGDLANPAKNLELSKEFTYRVIDEFFKQGDRERIRGLPVSTFMDRYDANIPKSQVGFIDVLVAPLFESWCQFSDTPVSQEHLANIARSRQYWFAMVERAQRAPDDVPTFVKLPDEVLLRDPFEPDRPTRGAGAAAAAGEGGTAAAVVGRGTPPAATGAGAGGEERAVVELRKARATSGRRRGAGAGGGGGGGGPAGAVYGAGGRNQGSGVSLASSKEEGEEGSGVAGAAAAAARGGGVVVGRLGGGVAGASAVGSTASFVASSNRDLKASVTSVRSLMPRQTVRSSTATLSGSAAAAVDAGGGVVLPPLAVDARGGHHGAEVAAAASAAAAAAAVSAAQQAQEQRRTILPQLLRKNGTAASSRASLRR